MRPVQRIHTSPTSSVARLLLLALVALPGAAHAQAHATEAAVDEVVERLIEGLSSRNAGERAGSASQLGKLGARAEAAVPFLAALLDDDEEAFAGWDDNGHGLWITPASCASSALLEIGSPGVSALIEALDSRKADVRELAAQSLRFADDPRRIEALIAAADDRNDAVRYSALIALPPDEPRMLEHYLAAAADRYVFSRALAAKRLAAFDDPRAVDALVELVRQDDDVDIVCNASDALADIADPRAVPALLDALADRGLESTARGCAAASLTAFDDASIYDGLLAAADEADASLRFQALSALGRLGDRRAVPLMIERLSTGFRSDRAAAATGLGRLGDSRAVEPLKRALDDPDSRVRAQAAEALRALEGPRED
jgi:HEAT repeat protein